MFMINIRRVITLMLFTTLFGFVLAVVFAQDAYPESETLPYFMSIRRYEGVAPETFDEINRIVEEGFVPILSEVEGFVGYWTVFTNEEVAVSISIFTSLEAALESNELARDFVVESLAPLLPNDPQVTSGDLTINEVNLPDNMDSQDVSLFLSMRRYEGLAEGAREEITRIVGEGFLPLLNEVDGFVGYYTLFTEDEVGVSISIFTDLDAALASNEIARDFVIENLVPLLPNDPQITAGNVGFVHLVEMATDCSE